MVDNLEQEASEMKSAMDCNVLKSALRAALNVVRHSGVLLLVVPAAVSLANSSRTPLNVEAWEYSSQAGIANVQLIADGGAFIGNRFAEKDGRPIPEANTLCRIRPDGSVAWTYAPPEGYRVTFLESTPDGSCVLGKIVSIRDTSSMELVLLDQAGQVICQRGPMEDSNWVWLSPNGKSLLRWVDERHDIVIEDSRSGKKTWQLDGATTDIERESVSFVQPAWAAGCVLIGDSEHGNVDAVDFDGKPLWRLKNQKWYPPAKSPILISKSGNWILTSSARKSALQTSQSQDIEYRSYNAGGLARSKHDDELRLMRIKMSLDNPGQQEQADLVWERATSVSMIAEQQFPTRTGTGGGTIMFLDLLDYQAKSRLCATMVTSSSVVVLEFDQNGNLIREAPWPVSDIANVYEAWLISPTYLIVKRSKTNVSEEVLQLLDNTGNVVWEKKTNEPIAAVEFDCNRDYVAISTPHAVICCHVHP